MRRLVLAVLAALLVPPAPAQGADWTTAGELGLESRLFRGDGDGRTEDRAVGLLGRFEVRHRHGIFEEKLRGFGRRDRFDRERDLLIAEEAWVQAQGERLRLRLGLDIVNWSAMEAFHPADVINARNLDSDLESFEKIGEPMVSLQVRAREGMAVTLLYLPAYTESRLPSPHSRLNFAPPGVDLRRSRQLVDRHGALTGSDFGPQAAIQVRQVLGPADLTLHLLEHIDRLQPVTLIVPSGSGPVLLYQTVRQVGGTYQQAFGRAIAKLEGSYRSFVKPEAAVTDRLGTVPGRNHGTLAAGLEYGLPRAGGSESTFYLEGQAVIGVGEETRRALNPFQRDVFVGWRFARNDAASRELLVAAVADVERAGEYLVNASYQQRLGDAWTVKVGLRVFEARAVPAFAGSGLELLRNGDHLRLALTRHF